MFDGARFQRAPLIVRDGRFVGIKLITTTVPIERPNRASQREALREAQIANLRLLREPRVTLVAGSDEHEEASTAEIAHLPKLGVFDNAELLRMWSTDCARTLFPRWRVGGFSPGDEASFLVLGGDPLSNLDATRDIRVRVKEGVTLGSP